MTETPYKNVQLNVQLPVELALKFAPKVDPFEELYDAAGMLLGEALPNADNTSSWAKWSSPNANEAAKAAIRLRKFVKKNWASDPRCRHGVQAEVVGNSVYFRVIPLKYKAPPTPREDTTAKLLDPSAKAKRQWLCKTCNASFTSPMGLGQHFKNSFRCKQAHDKEKG